MAVKKTSREVVGLEWEFEESAEGTMSTERLTAAGALQSARMLREVRDLMVRLNHSGLHEVLQGLRRELNAKRKARLARARAMKKAVRS